MSDYNEQMDMVCNAARFKMKLNAHKGNIEDFGSEDLSQCAKAEIDEMMQAFDKEDWENVIIEAGDTLNFVLGIVSQAMNNYRKRYTANDH